MSARIHPSAIVEEGVEIGEGTSVWDHVHLRGPCSIGKKCIIGGKSLIAYDVRIGDMVKINSNVYICSQVTIERGVMIAAGVIFTNDVYPRASTTDFSALKSSEPDDTTKHTYIREGATLGAGAIIGCDLEVGRFAVVGMGAIVTRSIPDFHLVVGSPARSIGFVCRCGKPFHHFSTLPNTLQRTDCLSCSLSYEVRDGIVYELTPLTE